MTRREAAIISAYTGVLCVSFDALQEYVEEILGRSVFTHEMAERAEEIKEKSKKDFLLLCNSVE